MGISKVALLAPEFGSGWILDNFVPKVVESYNVDKQGYNYRMTALMSLAVVIPHLEKDKVSTQIVPHLMKAATDKIPNVQFCLARIIKDNANHFDSNIFQTQIVPKLKDMSQDGDKDVAYFAS